MRKQRGCSVFLISTLIHQATGRDLAELNKNLTMVPIPNWRVMPTNLDFRINDTRSIFQPTNKAADSSNTRVIRIATL